MELSSLSKDLCVDMLISSVMDSGHMHIRMTEIVFIVDCGSCDYVCMISLLIFHSRNFIFEIYMNEKQIHHSEEQFVTSFLTKSREHYGCQLFPKHTSTLSKKNLFDASVNHTLTGFVKEVICMHDIH